MPADDAVGNGVFDERTLDRTRHRIHAIKHRVVGKAPPARDGIRDLFGDKRRFCRFVLRRFERDLFARAVRRPEVLALALAVVCDHGVGGVQNILRRTVILFQADDSRVRVTCFKAQDILDRRAAEAVNALVVVADHADVAVAVRQKPRQAVLCMVGILILIHHHIAELPSVVLGNILVFLQKADGVEDQIVKIHRVGVFKKLLVFCVAFADLAKPDILPRRFQKFLGRDERIFRTADFGKDHFVRQEAVFNIQ